MKPWNTPIDITKPDAIEKIAELGEASRQVLMFKIICADHGLIGEVNEAGIEDLEDSHRKETKCSSRMRIK